MGKSKDKSTALGDDPLAWLNAGSDSGKKTEKKKVVSEKKADQKPKQKKVSAKKAVAEKAAEETVSSQDKADLNRLELESSLVINKASDFYQSLKKLLAGGQSIEIDASKVEIIDSAIMQLLFAFVLKLKEMDISYSWHKPSENLLNKASTLGLTEKLGL